MPGEVSGLRPPAPVLRGGSRIAAVSSPRRAQKTTSRTPRHAPYAYIMNPQNLSPPPARTVAFCGRCHRSRRTPRPVGASRLLALGLACTRACSECSECSECPTAARLEIDGQSAWRLILLRFGRLPATRTISKAKPRSQPARLCPMLVPEPDSRDPVPGIQTATSAGASGTMDPGDTGLRRCRQAPG